MLAQPLASAECLEDASLRDRLRAAVRQLVQALHFDPDDASTWHQLGTALARLGDRAGALTALRNALLLDSGRDDTHLALGKLLFDCGQLDDALICFSRVASPRET
jgi:Flp pilus assembly protein TadD